MTLSYEFDSSLPDTAKEILDLYRRCVFVEMYYLKNEGAREYKVTNGVRVGQVRGGYGYVFELEAEIYLAEDSPVKVSVDRVNKKDGTIVTCEDFHVYIVLERDIGEIVPQAYLSADPWKLLEALNERLATMSRSNGIALRLMLDGRRLKTDKPITLVDKGQEAAMEHVLDNPITVIWGPPGTGKTHTMSQIAIRLMLSGKSVLVVSHSNISVDGVVLKISELMEERGLEGRLEHGDVMRFGHTRDDRLRDNSQVVARNHALSDNAELKVRSIVLRDKLRKLQRSGQGTTAEAMTVRQEIARVSKSLQTEEERYAGRAKILATTVSRLYSNKIFEDKQYDVVMFDEASMAYVPQVICAAMFARQKMVVVGDFRQLAPIAQSDKAKKILSTDIFSYLGICDERQNAHYHPWLVMLDEQRRMHPDISAFSSQAFYSGLLKDHESMQHARDAVVASAPCPGKAVTLVDTRSLYCPTARNEDNSRFNILNAIISFGMALSAEKYGTKSVGVIAPYAAQVRLIRALIKDYNEHGGKTGIACSTVHQFQGSERDVVVFDTVESPPGKRPGVLTSSTENGSADRLVNVAITRARGKLITIANKDLWDMKSVRKSNPFLRLVTYELGHSNTLRARDLSLIAELYGLDFGPLIDLYTTGDANKVFLEDLASAKKMIVVSIPDNLLIPYDGWFIEALQAARDRGVQVLVKALNWSELPEALRKMSWQSGDVVFPLTVIDKRICWYEMPLTRGKILLDDSKSVVVAEHVPFRIAGHNTISLLMSFVDMETRKTEGLRTALQPRTTEHVEGAKGDDPDGFALFVRQKKRCTKCKAPMRLTKGRSGKFFFACTRCKETELIEPRFVDWYLSTADIKCPKCGLDLTAGVNRFGIHTKCGRNHYVNLDAI